jgi:hypothetical protein
MEHTKPPTYTLFTNSAGRWPLYTVVQLRRLESGELLTTSEVKLYVAKEAVETPWWRLRIAKGSKLLLADDAAKDLVESGTIAPLIAVPLIPWRNGQEAAQAEKYHSRRKPAPPPPPFPPAQ